MKRSLLQQPKYTPSYLNKLIRENELLTILFISFSYGIWVGITIDFLQLKYKFKIKRKLNTITFKCLNILRKIIKKKTGKLS